MTKAAALLNFFKGFGIDAYPDTSVPEDASFPYLTYSPIFDSYRGEEIFIPVNLWYRTTSEKTPNDKAQEISKFIGMGGRIVLCDEGALWIKRGSPFVQSMVAGDDNTLKRRYINITVEYITSD